ncbi:MAG: hypothetical protein KF685_08090 [Acidobacteria bacterium]|nr:hypothetical protein [Acidobacteriota bacterium]
MRKISYWFSFIFAALFLQPVIGQTAANVSAVDNDRAKIRTETFLKVWETVNEKHYDPTFGGVNWADVRKKYEPMAKAAASDEDLHAILREMLGELRLSHFSIFMESEDSSGSSQAGDPGIELKMIEGKPVTFRVVSDDDEKRELTTGMILGSIDGESVSKLLKPLEDSFAERALTEASKNIYRERFLEEKMRGTLGTKVVLEFSDGNGRSVKIEPTRKRFAGEFSQRLGNFPPQPVVFESKILGENIGYLRFNMWIIPQMAKIRAVMKEFAGMDGIIVDLRGNPGGIGGMATGMAGLMVKEQVSLGSMTSRSGKLEFIAYPQSEPFLGPIVVLVDHGSGSTSEVFASGMQETGRAVVVGETTAGAVLPSVFEKLPTGATFQYAISDYRSPKSVLIEGRGVKPDHFVGLDRGLLLRGKDSQLEKALEIVNSKRTEKEIK